MKVIVTKKDIKLGQPELTDSCPIALALKRKHLGKPSVESDYFTVTVRGEERRFDLPDNAKLFVENFDELVEQFNTINNTTLNLARIKNVLYNYVVYIL